MEHAGAGGKMYLVANVGAETAAYHRRYGSVCAAMAEVGVGGDVGQAGARAVAHHVVSYVARCRAIAVGAPVGRPTVAAARIVGHV